MKIETEIVQNLLCTYLVSATVWAQGLPNLKLGHKDYLWAAAFNGTDDLIRTVSFIKRAGEAGAGRWEWVDGGEKDMRKVCQFCLWGKWWVLFCSVFWKSSQKGQQSEETWSHHDGHTPTCPVFLIHTIAISEFCSLGFYSIISKAFKIHACCGLGRWLRR